MMHDTYESECDVCGARAKTISVKAVPQGWHKLTLPVCSEWKEKLGEVRDEYDVCPPCREAVKDAVRAVFTALAGTGAQPDRKAEEGRYLHQSG